jgi:hypothetical protein
VCRLFSIEAESWFCKPLEINARFLGGRHVSPFVGKRRLIFKVDFADTALRQATIGRARTSQAEAP